MALATGIAVYFLIWWLTLFITLPFRMRSQIESGDITQGTEPAAPSSPRMGRRLVWNTILAALVFAVYWLVTGYFGFSVDDLPRIISIREPD